MREIKFRGKSVDNGEWVYGNLVIIAGEYFIVGEGEWITSIDQYDIGYTKVISETVGQYTELKDINNVELYEGDIIRVKIGNDWQKNLGVIHHIYNIYVMQNDCPYYAITEFEIIGNIHDNSELLEEEA